VIRNIELYKDLIKPIAEGEIAASMVLIDRIGPDVDNICLANRC
jgi:hypothetical protein